MSKRAEEAAFKAEPGMSYSERVYHNAFLDGYEQAEKDIISIIESRLAELLGDAQLTLILRYELRDLIKKIKEEEK